MKQLSDASKVIKSLIRAKKSFHDKVAKKDPVLGMTQSKYDEGNRPVTLLGNVTPQWHSSHVRFER